MRKYKTIILILVILVGAWVLYHKDQISRPSDAFSLAGAKLKAFTASWGSAKNNPFGSTNGNHGQYGGRFLDGNLGQFADQIVRIASFKIAPGPQGSQLNTAALTGDICSRFDLIAIQADNAPAGYLRRIAAAASQSNRQYSLIEGPVNSNATGTNQFAFLFDANRIQLDDQKWYLVNDPDKALGNDPMVGWFRTKSARPEEAFTFSLANISLAQRRSDVELVQLGSLFRAIRQDGRGEDDIILAGDFNCGNRGLEPIAHQNGFVWAISNRPTNIENTRQHDNLVFNNQATVEFTGGSGVVDFMRKYNLRMADAQSVSGHMPVWADFSIFEGRLPGRFASEVGPAVR